MPFILRALMLFAGSVTSYRLVEMNTIRVMATGPDGATPSSNRVEEWALKHLASLWTTNGYWAVHTGGTTTLQNPELTNVYGGHCEPPGYFPQQRDDPDGFYSCYLRIKNGKTGTYEAPRWCFDDANDFTLTFSLGLYELDRNDAVFPTCSVPSSLSSGMTQTQKDILDATIDVLIFGASTVSPVFELVAFYCDVSEIWSYADLIDINGDDPGPVWTTVPFSSTAGQGATTIAIPASSTPYRSLTSRTLGRYYTRQSTDNMRGARLFMTTKTYAGTCADYFKKEDPTLFANGLPENYLASYRGKGV